MRKLEYPPPPRPRSAEAEIFRPRYCLSAANQLTDYVYDETGLLREILSKYRGEEKVDRKIAREYDALDR
ncbi:hypothetical protein, partial [Victivallis sp.]|uniref:hypothetical protein n=1 Tax=Victivallis sp. TaxID=2049020 RepID=UPI003A9389A3